MCVFQSENKIEAINKSEYLKKALQKLSVLSGSLVIIGSSLDDNDSHIFEQIETSKIGSVYISTREGSKRKNYNKAKKYSQLKRYFFLMLNQFLMNYLIDNKNKRQKFPPLRPLPFCLLFEKNKEF